MDELQNIEFLKKLAGEAQRLSLPGKTANPEWQRAYKFIAQGAGLLWRLIEQEGQQFQPIER